MAGHPTPPSEAQWDNFKKKWFKKFDLWNQRDRAIGALRGAIRELDRVGGDTRALEQAIEKLLDENYEAGL